MQKNCHLRLEIHFWNTSRVVPKNYRVPVACFAKEWYWLEKEGHRAQRKLKKKPAIKHTPVEGSFASDHEGNEGLDHSQVGETDMEPDGWELQGSPRCKGGRNSPNPTNRSFSEVACQGAQQGTSRLSNANRAMGPNPDFLHRHTHPVYWVRNEGAFRTRWK